MRKLTIATRGSKLALWQAEYIRDRLLQIEPDTEIALSVIHTKGDRILDVPLARVGGKGLFVKEIEDALLAGEADLAVHSIKDVPMQLPDGLCLGAVPAREECVDCLLSEKYEGLAMLPAHAAVGTSSLRRQAQLLTLRPDLRIMSLRGNVDTRLRKLREGEFDAIVLAMAGVKRLGLCARYMVRLRPLYFIPAVGQGALGIECRAADKEVCDLVRQLEDRDTRICVDAERALLRGLDGGCQVPIGAHAELEDGVLALDGLVAETDGSRVICMRATGSGAEAEQIGLRLAENLMKAGAADILNRLYADNRPER